MEDIDYADLYGVLPGETDFSGAMKRNTELKHFVGEKEYDELIKWMEERRKSKDPKVRQVLKDKINKFYEENKDAVFPKKDIHEKTNELILEYNRRMKDDENYPNKDEVRLWYSQQSQILISEGAFSFSFLYPDFMGPIEDLEKIYQKINKTLN